MKLWRTYAYAARYGHQPLSEIRALSLTELRMFVAALDDIVKEENHHEREEET